MTSMWRELYYKSESRKGHIWKDVLQVIGALKEAATQHIEISRNIFLRILQDTEGTVLFVFSSVSLPFY